MSRKRRSRSRASGQRASTSSCGGSPAGSVQGSPGASTRSGPMPSGSAPAGPTSRISGGSFSLVISSRPSRSGSIASPSEAAKVFAGRTSWSPWRTTSSMVGEQSALGPVQHEHRRGVLLEDQDRSRAVRGDRLELGTLSPLRDTLESREVQDVPLEVVRYQGRPGELRGGVADGDQQRRAPVRRAMDAQARHLPDRDVEQARGVERRVSHGAMVAGPGGTEGRSVRGGTGRSSGRDGPPGPAAGAAPG